MAILLLTYKGFFAHGLETCAGLYITDGTGKHGLLHVDKEVSEDSLRDVVSAHFPVITEFVYVKNPDLEFAYGDTQMARVFSKIRAVVEPLLGREIKKDELCDSTAGTLTVEIDRESGVAKEPELSLSCRLDLSARSIYDQDFESRRVDIHYANTACSNVEGVRRDLDLQYDGRKYTRLPKLLDDVASDFAVLSGYGLEFLSKGNLDFPKRFMADKLNVRPYGDEHEEDVAYCALIAYGFIFRGIFQSCDLVEYKIPLAEGDVEKERLIVKLAESVGEDSELNKMVNEGGRTICSVKLKPKSLTSEVCSTLGIDRREIGTLSDMQLEILRKSIPEFTIEAGNNGDASKVIITFPAGDENIAAIRDVVRSGGGVPSSSAALSGNDSAVLLKQDGVVASSSIVV